MRVCLGQINTTPGAFEENLERMLEGMKVAAKARCSVIVFPELSIPGYLSQDLLYQPRYIQKNLEALDRLCSATRDEAFASLHVVVGYLEPNPGPGKPFFNSAAVISEGKKVANYRKQLLPFYDVFDEARYFEAGDTLTILTICGHRVGITICEDLWNDKGEDHYTAERNPYARYREAGVDLLVSLNSSPFVQGKPEARMKRLVADQGDLTLVYVNQWGGQDELVFDGHSFVARGGRLLYAAQQVEADEFPVVDLSAVVDDTTQQERVPPEVSLRRLIVMSLRDYALKSGFRDAVVASSGGIDSALTIALACDALGPSHVHAIRMPSVFSSEHSKTDAKALHEALGCWDYEVPIEHLDLVASLNERFDHLHDPDHLVRRVWVENKYNSVADQNLQARLRDVYLMHFSNAFGALPLATGNKTESACGYFTHFDMNLSFAPIMDLYKRQVFEIAEQHPAIPRSIIEKRPSAELAPNQFDEESLLPYAILDAIVQGYVEEFKSDFNAFRSWATTVDQVISCDRDALLTWLSQDDSEAAYTRIIGLIGQMEFKRRQTCPGPKLSKVAFGIGRRVPIVKAFR